ncbi:unnamed protein product [Heligmosomoides polygyrus]|uniref:Uncharacterized protein n=1 Tax=Heligmosomoides polygyrus TaxID=6339 RepID=A0A183G672_HELPZ|nr:unnamed protein product [Heligmosomoides polygyrus]
MMVVAVPLHASGGIEAIVWLLYIIASISTAALLSIVDCCKKKDKSVELASKKGQGKQGHPHEVGEQPSGDKPSVTRSAETAQAPKKSVEKPAAPPPPPPPPPPAPPPAALPEAGGDDVGYESCPDMTPEELAKVVAAQK